MSTYTVTQRQAQQIGAGSLSTLGRQMLAAALIFAIGDF